MSRGGKRVGAGQKPKWKNGETKSVRVPVVLAEEILRLARLLDSGEKFMTLAEAEKLIKKDTPDEKILKTETETESKVLDLAGIPVVAIQGAMAVKLEELIKRGFKLKPDHMNKILTEGIKAKNLRK
ncbi:MAG: hypothetical protein ACRC80_24595 [Waterburya sp.]